MNVQLLVSAREFKTTLRLIEEGKPFEATLNYGRYAPKQFTAIVVDLSTYNIKNIRIDETTTKGDHLFNDTDEAFDCTVYPKSYTPITTDSERKLEPEL